MYSSIVNDGVYSTSDKVCNKYYSSSRKNGLTSGICALWCPHGICVGWHFMSADEGRNDIFSSLFVHWKLAPKIVIYDFACQLAEYCYVREFEFFSKTRFFVDRMHIKGHTCSSACSFVNVASVDSTLRPINTSIAESCNSILRRIGKSLSYMREDRAIVYANCFISYRNRKIYDDIIKKNG